jgi:hypothetical protein
VARTSLYQAQRHPAHSDALTTDDVARGFKFDLFKDGEGRPFKGKFIRLFSKNGEVMVQYELEGEYLAKRPAAVGLEKDSDHEWSLTYLLRRD